MLVTRVLVLILLISFNLGCATFGKKPISDNGDNPVMPEIIYNDDWEETEKFTLAENDNGDIWHWVVYHKHPTKPWYRSIHTVCNQKAIIAYAVRDENNNLAEHWFFFKKNNMWYWEETSISQTSYIPDYENGNPITRVEIALLDKERQVLISETYRCK